ncbi:MAG: DUF3788 family protein [Ignavibacteria bacterium]|nr:DUF3788 family protein [Ignavibacteria bacterium]
MNDLVLTNKDQFPTDEVIFSHIGKAKTHWESLFKHIHSEHPDFKEEWRYYNDGKSWLMKVTHKKKTIFWLSIIPKMFRITFYFGDKAEPAIMESAIPDEAKKNFMEGKRYGKIRGITLVMNSKKNIEAAKELITVKVKTK